MSIKFKHVPACFASFLVAVLFFTGSSFADVSKGKFFGAMDTEFPAWFKESFLDLKEDIDEASAKNRRVMLFFQQAGCPYCNALVERNLSQKNIEEKVRKHLDVIVINMWGDKELTHLDGKQYTEKTFAEALKVQFTPTLIFFNEAGEIILRLNGYRSPQRFNLDLDYVALRKENEISYREFIAENRSVGKTRKALVEEDFFSAPPHNFSQQSAGKSRLSAVFFEQKDCPNCVQLHTKVLTEPELRDTIRQFHVVQLDMWSNTPVITHDGSKTTAREWAKALDVKYAPSMVLFNENGEEVIRIEAFFKVFHNLGVFNYVLSGAYRQQPSFQRYLAEFADHRREQGLNVDIWRLSDKKPGQR